MDNKVRVTIGVLIVAIIGWLVVRKVFLEKSPEPEKPLVDLEPSISRTPITSRSF